MKTIWGETLDPNAVLQEYPRPQMVRGSYRNLNGLWDYAITDAAAPPERWDGEILVPFSPEAPLSGVGRTRRIRSVRSISTNGAWARTWAAIRRSPWT